MRPALAKVLKMTGEKNTELRRGAVDAVHALHAAAPAALVAQVCSGSSRS
jgi:hypothetical protein